MICHVSRRSLLDVDSLEGFRPIPTNPSPNLTPEKKGRPH